MDIVSALKSYFVASVGGMGDLGASGESGTSPSSVNFVSCAKKSQYIPIVSKDEIAMKTYRSRVQNTAPHDQSAVDEFHSQQPGLLEEQ